MTKKIFKTGVVLMLVIVILTASVFAASGGTGQALYENAVSLGNGLTYTNRISYNSSNHRVETFALETSPGGAYPIIMACDTIYGGMTVSKMISYAESLGYNVLGAINTDFFSTTSKVPLGVVIENGEYKSSPEDENVLAFDSSGAYVVESPEVNITLYNNGGGEYFDENGSLISNSGKSVSVEHLNKMRNSGGLYLFTSAFSTVSTRTSTDGWAVRMKVLSGEMKVSGTMSLQVEEVITSGTAFTIGEGYVVLTAAATAGLSDVMSSFAVGDSVTLTTSCNDTRFANAQWATGCGDILVENGEVTDSSNWDSALFSNHPRTAVGIKPDGSIVCYVIDGRSSSYSNGAKLSELAADLISMGCVSVVNLDGGGSSVMAVKMPGDTSCSVVNRPSDGSARSCGAYLLIVSDKKADGVAENLFLEDDGIFVLTGSSVELNYVASDSSSNAAKVPDTVYASSSGLGVINGNTYTAGSESGVDRISLSSPDGATGYGTIHVIDSVDNIKVYDESTGRSPDLTNMEDGDTIDLAVSLTELSRDVIFDQSNVSYHLSGSVGSITSDGVFTASGTPGSQGTIEVSAGGKSVRLSVTLKDGLVDIKGHWAEDYIETLFNNGVVQGTGDGRYQPNINITRGDFIVMLWRAMGEPEPAGSSGFSDVPSDSYYADAISWAHEIGVAQGVGNGAFQPKSYLLREQAFTLIYRLLAYTGSELPDGDAEILSSFSDGSSVADYAVEPVSSLITYGLIEGSGGKLSPKSPMTRGEMAKVLALAIY